MSVTLKRWTWTGDRRQQGGWTPPHHIDDAGVNSFKFLGMHITRTSWALHRDTMVKKAHQQLYFLRRLRKFRRNDSILTNFYRYTIEGLLMGLITHWYGTCSAHSRKSLQKIMEEAQHIIGNRLPAIQDNFHHLSLWKAHSVIKDYTHPDCSPCYCLADDTGALQHAPTDLRKVFTTRPSGLSTHLSKYSTLHIFLPAWLQCLLFTALFTALLI